MGNGRVWGPGGRQGVPAVKAELWDLGQVTFPWGLRFLTQRWGLCSPPAGLQDCWQQKPKGAPHQRPQCSSCEGQSWRTWAFTSGDMTTPLWTLLPPRQRAPRPTSTSPSPSSTWLSYQEQVAPRAWGWEGAQPPLLLLWQLCLDPRHQWCREEAAQESMGGVGSHTFYTTVSPLQTQSPTQSRGWAPVGLAVLQALWSPGLPSQKHLSGATLRPL